jgi:rubrerythrin
MHGRITSVAEFYAHALAIEREASERYAEFQRHFAERGEEVLAGLCGNLARLEHEHFTQLVRASGHMPLPAIAEGEYQWLDSGSPEAPAREVLFRIANPRQLLEVALQAEYGALAFFEQVVRTTRDPEVRALAREMAAEEAQHVRWVQNALEYHAPAGCDPDRR